MKRGTRALLGLLLGLPFPLLTMPGSTCAQPLPPADEPASVPGVPDVAPAEPAPFLESLPKDVRGVPGTWDLSRDGSTRRCVMTLTAQSTDAGRRLSFPAGCRRALPILGGVAGWLFADDAIRLVDKNVRPVLLFSVRPDARSMVARTEAGESYSLVPLQITAMVPAGLALPESPATAATSASDSTSRLDGTPPTDGPLAQQVAGDRASPGLYALDRFREQDVCRIELMPGIAEVLPVRILDGCRDSGLSTFDPISWRSVRGHMTLTAKRGHTVDLVPAGEGRWRREPEIGTTFVLRRIDGRTAAP